jgi:hypothetical protein
MFKSKKLSYCSTARFQILHMSTYHRFLPPPGKPKSKNGSVSDCQTGTGRVADEGNWIASCCSSRPFVTVYLKLVYSIMTAPPPKAFSTREQLDIHLVICTDTPPVTMVAMTAHKSNLTFTTVTTNVDSN